jgi:Asp/Glu/hydantoin racemase
VATSSLLQAPFIQRLLGPRKQVGILTISAGSLSEAHLAAAGVPPGTPVLGTEGGREFTRAILNDEPDLDIDLARQDILDAGAELLAVHPDVGAILLECTNMAPYSKSLQAATGVPVFDIYTFLTWFQSALSPRDFTVDASMPR